MAVSLTYSTSSGTAYLIYPAWTTSATTGVTWNTWPDQATTGISALNQVTDALGNLVQAYQMADLGWQSFRYSWPQYQETASQRADRERRRDEAIRESQRRRAAMARVTERAETLLLGLLDPVQAASYAERGWFEVTGSAGGRFRINRRGQAGNIDELPADGDYRIASYCIHPSGGFPDADAHVAQFLRLVTDEPGFRRVANRTPRRRLPVAA